MNKSEYNPRIAYFIDRLTRGGTELQLCEQINYLHKKGIEQELFCLYKSEDHDDLHVSCKVHILEIRRLVSIKCLRKLYFLIRYLKSREFNIVQTYFFDSTVIGVCAGKMAGGVKIISCRRDLGFWYTPKLIMSLKLLNKMTDRILVNSESAKQSVVKKERVDPEDIDVIPNGIDTTKFIHSEEERHVNRQAFGLKTGECCIGIIANMSRPVKRVDIFLKAAAEVYKHEKNTMFLVLGDGYLKDELKKLTRILGIESRTRFLGLQKEVIPYLASFDIGVCTSDSEGFSNAILEYMAMGLPVVATNVGGNKEAIQDEINGFLVEPNNPEAVAESILKIMMNGDLKRKMSQNSLRMARHYSWENKIKEIESYYGQMIFGRELCGQN